MLHEAEGKDVFVTFHSERDSERIVANKLSQALNCKAVTFREISSDIEPIPVTQTRIAFHGHGGSDMFGSMDHHLSPDEFAKEMITMLAAHPNIKDIDLLSCNLGLLDSGGNCYAGCVQSHLDKAGFGHVNINTFIVDNKDGLVLDSFFIVGMSDESGPEFLKPNQFSLDILRKDNQDQIEVHEAIKEVEGQLYQCNVKMDLLAAIRNVCKGDDVTLDNLQKEMRGLGYNDKIFAKIIKEYDVKIHAMPDEDPYFTCNVINSEKQYKFKKDAQEDMYVMERQIPELHKRHEILQKRFAKLRSESDNTREFVSDIKNIQSYLVPMREVTKYNLYTKIHRLGMLKSDVEPKILGKQIMDIVNAYKSSSTVQMLDVYVNNLARLIHSYKSTNPQRILALNQLAMKIGIIYGEHIHGDVDVKICIDKLKVEARYICDEIRANHKVTGTLSFPKFPGGGFSLTQSSLARNIGEAMVKSDKEVAELEKVSDKLTVKHEL